jgi:heparan-alpha-glucosaminide N-acetyltransferase
MGTFNCIVLTFLGTQTGNIFVKYANPWKRIKLCMLWSAISFLVFNCLCINGMFNSENCLIPVNKNLWTLSYTWIMAACSNTILAVLYYLVDVEKLWLGKPFKYLGMNSVLIYILHVLFGSTFPIQFIVQNTHVHQTFMDLWGSVFWTLFAIYLYYNNFFFSF